jgi:thiol-disulfide isomerase/thioredoxin
MKNMFKFNSLLLSFTILFGCTQYKPDTSVSIVFEGQGYTNEESTSVSLVNIFDFGKSVIAETNRTNDTLSFAINSPTFANLSLNGQTHLIYVEPGFKLKINASEKEGRILFTGIGAEINNYLIQSLELIRNIELQKGKHLSQLEIDEFLSGLDTLEKSLNAFRGHFIDSVKLPEKIGSLLKQREMLYILALKQSYGWNYGVMHNFEIPEPVTINIPFDSALFFAGSIEYGAILHVHMYSTYFTGKQAEANEQGEKQFTENASTIERKIKQANYPSYITEYLLGKNVDYWMRSLGIPPSVEKIYSNFKGFYPSSRYYSLLEGRHNKWIALAPGNQAPDIKGLTLDGKWDSLSNLAGKVIYVDVWATWCSPCIKEFPRTRELQKKFEEYDNLVFLFISIDENREAWKKMVLGDPGFKGVHLNHIAKGGSSSIVDFYQLDGVPRYMLIDENGLIIDANAPRPSSPAIENQIRNLLKKGI